MKGEKSLEGELEKAVTQRVEIVESREHDGSFSRLLESVRSW